MRNKLIILGWGGIGWLVRVREKNERKIYGFSLIRRRKTNVHIYIYILYTRSLRDTGIRTSSTHTSTPSPRPLPIYHSCDYDYDYDYNYNYDLININTITQIPYDHNRMDTNGIHGINSIQFNQSFHQFINQ